MKHDKKSAKLLSGDPSDRFMLRANDPDCQNVLDMRFAILCGYAGMESQPPISEIKIDHEDTLFNFACVVRNLKQENFGLR